MSKSLNDPKYVDLLVASVQQKLIEDEESLFFSLGIGVVYLNAPKGVSYSAPYEEIGREFWVALRYEMYKILCDESNAAPTEWLTELISGDIRNMIVGIMSAITSQFDIGAGIAIPAVALVLKKGITKFCSTTPPKAPTPTLQQILEEKQQRAKRRDSKKARNRGRRMY